MDKQQRSESHMERLLLWLLSLLLALLVLWQLPIGDAQRSVPANLVQQRFLESLYAVRGQWLLNNQPQLLPWQAPDGQAYQLPMLQERGWPDPQQNCGLLWHQLMGSEADALLQVQQFDQGHCRFVLNDLAELHYYPSTGSVLLYD
ncbi:hypothetical protein [uncultured Ferrimonas sp.]|uniref:hypothetical protein n=1 Tax=uncultured Ferrimonas sp. TaxID=432640 RepID=UPI002627209C|nr:hypothetical protein [uncultured Ferrimonas sp.]